MAEVNATRDCVVCGATFPRKGAVRLCSDECRVVRQREHCAVLSLLQLKQGRKVVQYVRCIAQE